MKTRTSRVYRGGSWDDSASFLRALFGTWTGPSARDYYLGFRLVKPDDRFPDTGEGEKPGTTCSNGEHP